MDFKTFHLESACKNYKLFSFSYCVGSNQPAQPALLAKIWPLWQALYLDGAHGEGNYLDGQAPNLRPFRGLEFHLMTHYFEQCLQITQNFVLFLFASKTTAIQAGMFVYNL
jgi:hypothetical protein